MGRVVIPGFRKIETSGGGEGETTNYNDLTNKPSINNVPLVGNLKTVDLKLTDATLTEEGVPAEAKTVGQKLEEQSTSLTALSGQLGNHTVKSDVPENAVFTDTVYDDTGVKEEIDKINSNLGGYVFDASNIEQGNWYYDHPDEQNYSRSKRGTFLTSGTKAYVTNNTNMYLFITDYNGENFDANNIVHLTVGETRLFNVPSGHDYRWYTDERVDNTEEFASNIIISKSGISKSVANQNASLNAQNLDNKYNGWSQLGTDTERIICDVPCEEEMIIHAIPNFDMLTVGGSVYGFYNSSNELIGDMVNFTEEIKVNAPSNANYVRFLLYKSGGFTSYNYPIEIYVDNPIDVLKNDLGGLSFSVSGITLSITDGTNTWTLSQ